jgi:hypothetical protein
MAYENYQIKPLVKARDIYNQIVIKEKYNLSHDDILMICRTIINETLEYSKEEHQEYLAEVRNCFNHI